MDKRQFNRELITLAVPLALQNLLTALVGATDALMLGRLTQNAIAAVSLANQISFILSLFTGAVIIAASVLIAQYYGKGDRLNAKRFLCMSIRYVFGICMIFFALAFFIPETLMRLYTPEKELIRIGAEYLKIVSFSYLFNGLAQCYLMVMKVEGRAKLSVVISAVTVAVDVTADIFLIYGFGSFKGFGSNGSAYSTIAVELICLVWCVADSRRENHLHPDKAGMLHFSKAFEIDLWKITLGTLASSLSWGLSISAQSFIMGHMGTDATAAASIAAVTRQLVQCVTQGVSAGAGIMIGKLLGQSLFEEAKLYGRRFCKVAAINGLINAALLCVVGPLIFYLYVLEPQAKTYLIQMLLFSALYLFSYSFTMTITCGIFPAGGDSKYDAYTCIAATWLFTFPLSMLGCFVFNWPVMAVYTVMCFDEILKTLFIYPRYRKFIWLRNLTKDDPETKSL